MVGVHNVMNCVLAVLFFGNIIDSQLILSCTTSDISNPDWTISFFGL